MFDAHDAARRAEQPAGLRRRARRPRRRPQPAPSRRAPRCSATSRSVMAQPRRPAHRPPALLQGARRRRAHRRAGLEDQRAPVHDDGRHVRGDLARPAGAEGHDRQEPADARRRRPRRCACSARSSSTPPRSSRDLDAAADRAARRAADAQLGAARRHAGAAALGRAQRRPAGRARTRSSDLVKAPTTLGALRGLTATVGTLQPQLRYLGPYVTVCNYWNMFWTFAAEHFSAPDDTGGSERALLNMARGSRDRRHRRRRAPTSSPTARARCHGSAAQYLHNNFYGAGRRRGRQRRLRRRPAGLHPRPTTRYATRRQGRPLPARVGRPSASRSTAASARPTRSSTATARASA